MSAVPGPPAPDPESMDILASAAMDAQRRGFERLCLICLHGFNGATCPRCPLTSGAPGPAPPAGPEGWVDVRHVPWQALNAVLVACAPTPTGRPGAEAYAEELRAELLKLAARYGPPVSPGAPPAGLTVAQLADLLWEGSWELDLDPPARAMMEKLAAWLAPRLSGSPGAPAAARRGPTEAMIEAAARAWYEAAGADYATVDERTKARLRANANEALRAALAAQDRT